MSDTKEITETGEYIQILTQTLDSVKLSHHERGNKIIYYYSVRIDQDHLTGMDYFNPEVIKQVKLSSVMSLPVLNRYVDDLVCVIFKPKKLESKNGVSIITVDKILSVNRREDIEKFYPYIDRFVVNDSKNYFFPTKLQPNCRGGEEVDVDPCNKILWIDNKQLAQFQKYLKFRNIANEFHL